MRGIIVIGPSSSAIKYISIPNNTFLPVKNICINKYNWFTNDIYSDSFTVSIHDNTCQVQRTALMQIMAGI
jgi:hypothetical protein